MRQLKICQQVTPREEISLDKYLSEISRHQLISVEEEVALAQRIKNGDKEALNRMVLANLRFVVSVSKQYQYLGLSLPDLINEGNVGLIKAAYRFEETRGFRFISYAVWWIRQSIMQALASQSRTVKIPSRQISILSKLNRVASEFEQQNEREPTIFELSSAIEQHPDDIKSLLLAAGQAVSLDAPVNQEESTCMCDLLSDTDSAVPENALEHESLCSEVDRVLNSLPHREALVIRLFFGLNGYSQHAVKDIAERLDISASMVRQLKNMALARLRNTRRASMLQGYLD